MGISPVACRKCRQSNTAGARFCGTCGGPLEVVCASCLATNPLGNRFCHGCGRALVDRSGDAPGTPHSYTPRHLAERILNSRASLEGERKQVTVLFADVQGFTELAEGKDPEDVHLLMDEVFAILLDTVHRYEGTINQFLGDGVMALFGAPIALEDHALPAVKAALEIQEQITARADDFRARFGIAPALRIGLNSGRVVVGKIGDDLRMDYTAQGDTVNLAARLQQIAEPGRVAMGPATRRLVADSVECLSLGPHPIKGQTMPVEVFRPVRALDRGESTEVLPDRGLSPFIGREDELDLLVDLFDEVSGGQTRTVRVAGEAGAGKSRLLTELRCRVNHPGLQWFTGRCVPYGRSTPYRPIIKSLRLALGLQEGVSRQLGIEALDALLAPLGDRRNEVAPVIRYLLGLQTSDAELSPLSAADRRAVVTRAIDVVIEGLAARGPLVLVWEDCQWLDPVSAEYLASIAQRLSPGPILFILTYRSEGSGRAASLPPGEDVALHPLTASQATSLVTRLASNQLPPYLVALAVERAGGNPLFLEEVTRALVEARTDSVPATVETLLRARIDRLTPHLKKIVETSALIGQEFSQVLLEQVLGEAQDLTIALHELVDEGVLAGSDVSTGVFLFRQPLLQEVAYEGWLTHRRKVLHRRIGETIERLYPDRLFEYAEKLARHFTRSEEWERAVYYHRAAGRKAATLCANREAIQRFSRALEMLERLPKGPEQAGQAIDLRLDLCSPNLQLGSLDEVLRLCQEAEPLARALGDEQRLADVYSHLSNYHYLKGEPDTATEFGRLCLATAMGGEATLAHSPRQYLGTCYHVLGRYQEAVTILTEHIDTIERGDEVRKFGPTNLSYVSSCGWLAFALTELGEFGRAHEIAERATRAAATAGHAYVEAIASTFAGLVWQAQGELDRAVPILSQSFNTCLGHQLVVWRPIVGALLGHAHVLQGRVPLGLDLLSEAAVLTEQLQVVAYRALWTARLAEALLVAGQLTKALETARRAAELAVRHKERGNHARAVVVLGTACLRLGPGSFEQARDYLQQALSEAEALNMRPLIARCYDVLALLAGEEGDAATAWQLRETAKGIQRELGVMAWWDGLVNPPAAATERAPDLRRHARAPLSWPVTVDSGQRRLHLRTTNISAFGAKVRSDEALEVGTSARLHFERPDGRALDVQATVSRADADGLVFAFKSALDQELQTALRPGGSSFSRG
jgi:class 3 adenylate cyclase/tetratricopeptide (TPR) repeat protein